MEPAQELSLKTLIRGVRYPDHALQALKKAGIAFGGWIANAEVPAAFARYRVTVHIPRRPYIENLPGIPTIRPFEAMACGIPLISAPWDDAEHLFRPEHDYLIAENGAAMKARLRDVLSDDQLASSLVSSGRQTILARHTCRHRVDELLAILAGCGTVRVTEKLAAREAAE